ncbi:MAG: phage/plasmid primase, P4 family [Nitrospiraceae bacterium]
MNTKPSSDTDTTHSQVKNPHPPARGASAFPVGVNKNDTPLVRYNVVQHPSKVLVKSYCIVKGAIVKDTSQSGRIPKGCTVTTISTTLKEYVDEACAGGSRQYILPANVDLGTHTPLSPKKFVADGGVDRTANTLVYVAGPAVVTVDHDPHTDSQFTFETPEKLWAELVRLFPSAFEGAARGSYYSSSSFLYDPDGTAYSEAKGHHTAFAVADASDLSRFSEALFKRLWLLGYGYIMITRSGTMLPRTIFDQKVLEPQQPLFAGGADCRDGITQRRPEPIVNDGGYVNTQAVASLSDEEHTRFAMLVERAKAERSADAKKVAIQYKEAAVAALLDKGISVQRAIRTIESRIGGTLTGPDVLWFAEQGEVTVSDVLADPDTYDRCYLHDPMERDYGSASTAIFFSNNITGKPQVFSHAHGGRSYFLKYDEEALVARLHAMSDEDVRNGWCPLVASADLPGDALERVLKSIVPATGATLTILRQSFKDYLKAIRVKQQEVAQDPSVKLVDTLLAEQFNSGGHLIYTESKQFWSYNGRYWEKLNDAVLRGRIQDMATERWDWIIGMVAAQGKKTPPIMASFVESTLAVFKSRTIKEGDPLRLMAPRKSVINLQNGSLWLEDHGPHLRSHNPEDYLTCCSELAYDPQATARTFESLLRSMLCHEDGKPFDDQDEMVRYVLELLGYVCQSARFLKVFYILYGPGNNGKTQLARLLQMILGLEAIAFDRLSGVNEEGSRFAAARLIGKLALIDDDATNDYQLPDGFLKKIAEEKPLTAEEKFKGPMTFICQVVPIILTNSLPITTDNSAGMRIRAQILHFPRQFKPAAEVGSDHADVQRPDLWDRVFTLELPGTLNLLIDGFYRVKARGSFLPPPSAERAFDMWLSNTNTVPRFVSEACERIDSAKWEHTTSMFFKALISWCEVEKVQERFRPSQHTLRKRLTELGHVIRHTKSGSAVFGLRIKPRWKPYENTDDDPEKVKVELLAEAAAEYL